MVLVSCFLLNGTPVRLDGRAAAKWQGAALMAKAHGGGRSPDGHNPEVAPPA